MENYSERYTSNARQVLAEFEIAVRLEAKNETAIYNANPDLQEAFDRILRKVRGGKTSA